MSHLHAKGDACTGSVKPIFGYEKGFPFILQLPIFAYLEGVYLLMEDILQSVFYITAILGGFGAGLSYLIKNQVRFAVAGLESKIFIIQKSIDSLEKKQDEIGVAVHEISNNVSRINESLKNNFHLGAQFEQQFIRLPETPKEAPQKSLPIKSKNK